MQKQGGIADNSPLGKKIKDKTDSYFLKVVYKALLKTKAKCRMKTENKRIRRKIRK